MVKNGNVCFILKADIQEEVMIGSYRPKADVRHVAYYLPLPTRSSRTLYEQMSRI